MAVAGNAIDRTPKSVDAAPTRAVAAGTRVNRGDGRPGTALSMATNQKAGRLHDELHERAEAVSKADRSPEQRRYTQDEGSRPGRRLGDGCPVFSAIRKNSPESPRPPAHEA